ncbi:unnamed protein product [Cochlearia groenlandica]
MFTKFLTITFFLNLFISQSLQSSSLNLDFTFNGFHPPLTNLSIQGIATITSKGLLKLTNITLMESGQAFYNKPIRFKDSPNATVYSFSTTFVLAIRPLVPGVGGDGMAFVIAPNFSHPTTTLGQYLGLFNIINNGNNTHHVLGIEFDTIQDIDDPDNNHVGIDINSLKSVKTSTAGYWEDENNEFKKLTLVSGKRLQVWVDYDGRSHKIDVTMAPFRKDKPKKPLVSIFKDLSSVFEQDMFVGFSSATSTVVSEHFVLGWSFRINGKAPLLALSNLPKLEPRRWMYLIGIILIILLFIVVLLLIPILIICSPIFLIRFIVKRRKKFAEELKDWETEFSKSRLKFKDLYYATKGFKDKGLLGSGGFGSVYKGVMPKTKKEIAVKRVSNNSQQGLKEFVSEIEQVVIHRDVKSSNVLLDAKHNGRLGDFSLARLCGLGLDPETTHVAGTWGYT